MHVPDSTCTTSGQHHVLVHACGPSMHPSRPFGATRLSGSRGQQSQQTPSRQAIICMAEEPRKRRVIGSGGDGGFLDYMLGGPKLRRWYGAADLPQDGKPPPVPPSEQPPEPPVTPEEPQLDLEAVLVLDADSPMGELIVLQLILARAQVRILVKSAAAATTAFGPYVQPIEGSLSDAAALQRALNGAKTVVVPGKLGALLPALEQATGQRSVVLVSSAGAPSPGVLSFLDPYAAVLRDPAREAEVLRALPTSSTIVRAARIRDAPGGAAAIDIQGMAAEAAVEGEVCREDLARVVAAAALQEIEGGLVLRVANTPGSPPVDVAAQLASAL